MKGKTMKNSKIIKIFATMAALLALILAIGIVAGAEDDTLSVKINARNVSYGDTVKVLFAVDNTNAGDNEVEVLYFLENPAENPNATAYKGVSYDKGYTDKMGTEDTSDDVTYPAFFTAGFPAKNIGDAVYAVAHIVGTDIYSEVERYSVVEYLLERLYVDLATGDKAELYKYLLGYGTYAQKVVLNGNDDPRDDVDKFINEYVLVKIVDGTLDGTYSQGTYFAGDTVTPYREGALGWNVTLYDVTTGTPSTTKVANGDTVTVEGFTMITESDEEIGGAYKPNLNDTIGRLLWSESNNVSDYKALGYLDYWMGSGAALEIVDGAPYGEASKVLHFASKEHASNQDQLFVRNTAAYANSAVAAFEADILVNPTVASTYEFRFMNNTLASADRTAYILYVRFETDGSAKIFGDGFEEIKAPGVSGNWFRFRAEYIDVSATEFKIAAYFNGTKILETSAMTKTKGANHASPVINQMLVAAFKSAVCDMYLDNVKLSHDAPAFAPTISDARNTETYEDNDELNVFRFDNAPNDKGGVVDGAPYGTDSKVYAYDYVQGNEVNFRYKSTYNGTDKAVFETDMMIDSSAASSIKLELRGASNGLTVMIATDATGAVIVKTTSGTVLTPIVPGAEWFRLRVECAGSTASFFINDVKLGDLSISIDGKTVNRYRFYVDGGAGTMYFDNTRVIFAQ